MAEAWVGLGGNLGDAHAILRSAVSDLHALTSSSQIEVSGLYASAPMGPQDQPDYLNAAVRFVTDLAPLDLLDALQSIEQEHQRQRLRHWGERTLDLDLLFYEDWVIHTPRLIVPHPGIAQREFVLLPLQDLLGQEDLPVLGPMKPLLNDCPSYHTQRIYEAHAWLSA